MARAEVRALPPDDPDTLNSMADSCLGRGEIEPALRYYRRVAEIRPQSAKAHTNVGRAEEQVGDQAAAVLCYRRALELQPGSPAAYGRLATLLRQRGEFTEALKLCQRAVALDPARHESYNDLALVLSDMKNLIGATEAFRRSLALKPDFAPTYVSLGHFFFKNGDMQGAADSFCHALKLDSGNLLIHLPLGMALTELGDRAGARACYERARAAAPTCSEAIFYVGLMDLAEGNFAQGWEGYEQRRTGRRLRKAFPQPQWRGEPLEGARIFLYAEQGIGDTLQFVRYVPLVAAREGEVVLAVQKRLHRLLAGTEGACQVITDGDAQPDFQAHCRLLSLPWALGTELQTIPAKIPYVHADPAQVELWRQRLARDSLRIGLAWAGGAQNPHDVRRSIALEQLAPLTRLEGMTFYSLQMGAPAGQLRQLGSRVRLIDLQDEQADFADTAAIVDHLDLVISVDTSVAHLAGAMGKPVWVLLHHAPDWRWMLEREDSPWCPTARLFRQRGPGNWPEVVVRVERELRALAAGGPRAAGNACPQR